MKLNNAYNENNYSSPDYIQNKLGRNVLATFLLLGAVKNQISVGPGYLLDP